MPTWNAEQYLKFDEERTRPCHDLLARISLQPRTVVDLGCGPGNSTTVLANRWPEARTCGIDSSQAMIEQARQTCPAGEWIVEDILSFSEHADSAWDLVFSNAALQWVSDHPTLFPRLMQRVAPGGAFAAQVPANWDGPAHRAMREVAKEFGIAGKVREWHVHPISTYYNILAPHASRLDLWETTYIHILPDAEAIVEWYKGTGLRPFLQALDSESERERFTSLYLEAIRIAYPPQPDEKILFPFQRLFLIAVP